MYYNNHAYTILIMGSSILENWKYFKFPKVHVKESLRKIVTNSRPNKSFSALILLLVSLTHGFFPALLCVS
jgi:hypothetical protein